jgi:pantoate kinase
VSASRSVRARAFAPGHVTGIFAPATASRDPRARGSTGAGVVLEVGVVASAEFRPGSGYRVTVRSRASRSLPISTDVARRLRPRIAGELTVRLDHQLPIGQGFGMSAAGATATALAVGAIAGVPRRAAVEVAHLADLFGAGGLGGVAAIEGGGGLEFRLAGGVSPYGNVRHRRLDSSIFVGVVGGPMPSAGLLRSERFLRRVARAGGELPRLLRRPSARRFFEQSERFTDRLALAPPNLAQTIAALRRNGAWAAQSMFGRSFFAAPRSSPARSRVIDWLTQHRVRFAEVRPAGRGAHRIPATSSLSRRAGASAQLF